ncbi:MAG TPA: cystathionine gamma-lyase [Pseudonocardiaceae bacterium]|nr:cystathionine gamma-lyase [Pseudonocardiaceae bacterium]
MGEDWGDGTRSVHAGYPEPVAGQPFLPGPVFAAPYHLGAGGPADVTDGYGRASNPTWRALESALAELDGGHSVIFPSGMGALATTLRVLCRAGDTVIMPADGYFLARQLFAADLDHLDVRYVPTTGPWTADAVAGARLVLIETPSNPGMEVCDITAIAELVHAEGGLLAVDNTTATPLGQRPLALGADLSVASDSKALAGHSDLLLGHVSCADAELAERLRTARSVGGLAPGPFETWLVHRGLGSLDLRLGRQAANAAALTELMLDHPAVARVRWPGLSGDPGHAIAKRQMRRFNGVFSFVLSSVDAVNVFLATTRFVVAATSFGGLHSTADRRAQWGDPVPAALVRFSCGCEDTDDLVADVRQALDRVQSAGRA